MRIFLPCSMFEAMIGLDWGADGRICSIKDMIEHLKRTYRNSKHMVYKMILGKNQYQMQLGH